MQTDTHRLIIGIDPGASGAIAVLADGTFVTARDMPTLTRKAGGQQVNASALANYLRATLTVADGAYALIVIEQVGAMPGQGVTSMFRFGESVGVVRGVVAALRLPLLSVTPMVWKRHHGLVGADKDVARTRAVDLFPEAAEHLGRKKDVGRADALLIAAWAAATEQIGQAA